MSTIDGLYADQCWISNNLSLFYNAVHNKHPSVRSSTKKAVKHQAPPSIVPLFILFRQVCMSVTSPDSNAVIPTLPTRTFTMKNALCAHFQIDPKIVSALDIRHLYTTITNIIYNEHSNSNELVANITGAQLNNHTHAMHQQFYATTIIGSEAKMIETYHSFRRVPPQFFLVFATGTKCTYGPHTSSYVQVKMLWKKLIFFHHKNFWHEIFIIFVG